MSGTDQSIDTLASFAGRLADAARAETLCRFRAPHLEADDKNQGGRFDPVTVADRAAEAAIRALISAERPEDGVFGEEEARTPSRSGLTWVVDPIDGTRAFISGLPLWGTLIGLDDGHTGRLGIVDLPYTDERYLGIAGAGAWMSRGGTRRPIAVREVGGLSSATLMTTDPDLFDAAERPAFDAVRARARLTRLGGDCTAYALLALGQIDVVIESGLQAYDIAAPKVVIEAAGGVVTDWVGGDCRWGGRVVAAATPALHEEVCALLTTG